MGSTSAVSALARSSAAAGPGHDDRAREVVGAACRLLEASDERALTAAELAEALDVSTDVLRRSFRRVLDVTPRQYADTLRRGRLRARLGAAPDVTSALYDAGYGSASRLYESAEEHLGMTPGSYRAGGAGITITYAVVSSELGRLLVAATPRGLCSISLGDSDAALERRLRDEFHAADIARDDGALQDAVIEVLRIVEGRSRAIELPIDVRGTAFQRRVWEALVRIPRGETRTYGEVAAAIGAPRAARAVGTACATNPLPLVVPCHRVVPSSGGVGNYAFGAERKRALLEREHALVETTDQPS